VTTKAPSTEHIVPIPMSQRPNTTAPDATLQAFVHTINTGDLAASHHTSSSTSILPVLATATLLAQKPDEINSAASSLNTAAAPRETTGAKFGEKLHHYLHSVAMEKPSTTQTHEVHTGSPPSSALEQPSTTQTHDEPTASPSTTTQATTPIISANHNDTQAITLISSNTSVLLTQTQPTAIPRAYKPAHHHSRARRFIS
jgi:hypothetical protein